MALSGSGGAYYAGGNIAGAAGMNAAMTRHAFIKSNAIPSTTGFKTPYQFRGTGTGSCHEQMNWNHVAAYYGGHSRRNSSGSYVPAQMTVANLTANVWHALGATFDGSNLRSYLDGVADGVSGSTSAANGADIWIDILCGTTNGSTLDSSTNFTMGEIAELAFWNAALTAEEMAILAKGFRPTLVRPQSLVYYNPLVRSLGDLRRGLIASKLTGTEAIVDHPRVFG